MPLGAPVAVVAVAPIVAAVVLFAFSRDAVRLSFPAVAALRFACSIIPCAAAEMADVAADAADFNGEAGLRGDMGRAINDFAGEEGFKGLVVVWSPLMGERGSVRELWERGERTFAGFMVRDAARVEVVVVALPPRVFFAMGSSSGPEFSLS